jgi:hypothetical protein
MRCFQQQVSNTILISAGIPSLYSLQPSLYGFMQDAALQGRSIIKNCKSVEDGCNSQLAIGYLLK